MTEFSSDRRAVLAGGVSAAGLVLLSGCSESGGSPGGHPRNASEAAVPDDQIAAYVQSWDSAKELRQQHADLVQAHPGLAKLYFAFGEPDQQGNIHMPEMDPDAAAAFTDLVKDLGNLPVALSVGGYGDETSHQKLLGGWAVALDHPEAFAQETTKARAKLAGMLGRSVTEIGLDIDFEYPTVAQREKFTSLMNRLRGTLGTTALTLAMPAHDNQEGYDISQLEKIVDGINLMTYAYDNGSGTPKMVVDDVAAFAAKLKDPSKLIVGYSTDAQNDPLISSPAAMGKIHQAIGGRGIRTGGSFVWRSNGLSSEALRQLHLGVAAG
ncbi:MAG TPA: glycosyl hydrolase family 18 protein [Candidatus Saccharimonadales bacterium]|nr:glycosyl hydrolase family 18 protein [Candidatus Saccharimonadales bacterium]